MCEEEQDSLLCTLPSVPSQVLLFITLVTATTWCRWGRKARRRERHRNSLLQTLVGNPSFFILSFSFILFELSLTAFSGSVSAFFPAPAPRKASANGSHLPALSSCQRLWTGIKFQAADSQKGHL